MSEFITEEGKEVLAKYDSVIAELVKILTPHIKKVVVAEISNNDQAVLEMIKSEVLEAFEKYDLSEAVEGAIADYDLDDIIETRCNELGLLDEDRVEEMIKDHEPALDLDGYKFESAVKRVVRDMDFKVEVD
jgi:2-phospho-L-lactate guanylyltransferase (CobY/MobA/RfbA family)